MRAFTSDEKTNSGLEVTHRGWLLSLVPVGLDPVYLNTIGADYSDTSTSPATTFLGDPGFVMGSARITDGSDPAALDIEIPVSDDGPVDPDDVTSGLYQGAEVVLRIVDYENDDVSPPIGFKWVVGETRITNDGRAVFEIRAATRVNRELVLKKFTTLCPYSVGDARCGLNMASFTDTVEVATVTSLYEITVTGTSRANGFFDNGGFKFTSGGLTGRAFTVRKYTLATGQILFWERLPALPVVGDDATVHAGDDKTIATCHTKFNNVARFGGFAHLPNSETKFTDERPPPAPSVVSRPSEPTYPGWIPYGTGGGGFR